VGAPEPVSLGRRQIESAGSGRSADAASRDGAPDGGVTEPESHRIVTGHRVRTHGADGSVPGLGCATREHLHPLVKGLEVGVGRLR